MPHLPTGRHPSSGRRRAHRPVLRSAALAVLMALTLLSGGAASAQTLRPPVPSQTPPDPYAAYRGQVSCDPVEKPGVTGLRQILSVYGTGRMSSTRACSLSSRSEHQEGRALDWMVHANVPDQRRAGDDFVTWLTAADADGEPAGNARRLGVMYIIWNGYTWSSYRASAGWVPYTGSNPHVDHVHISLSWDGAWKRTSWWTGVRITAQDVGPCVEYVGEFAPPYSAPRYTPCPQPRTRPVATAQSGTSMAQDFNGDGHPDTLGRTGAGGLWFYPSDARGAAVDRRHAGDGWDMHDTLLPTADVTGDGRPDLWARHRTTGDLWVYPGNGAGGFSAGRVVGHGWGIVDAMTSAGDVTGDGVPDLWAREAATGYLWLYVGDGAGGFSARRVVGAGWGIHTSLHSAGDTDGDGRADLWGREAGTGVLWHYSGDGAGGFSSRRAAGAGWGMHDTLVGRTGATAGIFGRERATGDRWVYDGDGAGGFTSRRLVDQGWNTLDLVV